MIDLRSAAHALGGEVSGGQVLAPGPGHSPKDRSLSVKPDPNAPGEFIVFSFVGQDWQTCKDYVREKLGLVRPTETNGAGSKQILAAYKYTDEAGQAAFRVVRRPGKKFTHERADGAGGWISGRGCMDGVRRVPYRLPDVIKAVQSGQPIYIAEGEKDCDALDRLGVIATCNSGGAGNWKEEHSRPFRGGNVIIIPDKDETGEKHLSVVGAALAGVAARVRVLRLPGSGKDAFDWIAAGGTIEQLWQLVEAAPDWGAAASDIPKPNINKSKADEPRQVRCTFADEIEPEPIDWLWEGRLALGKITMVGGNPEVGKTLEAVDNVARISTGRHWPQGPRAPIGSAFILSAEDGAADTIRPRLEAAGADLANVGIVSAVVGKGKIFSLQDDLDQLVEIMQRAPLPPKFLLIDPITAYLGGDLDSHRTTDVRAALAPLEAFTERTHISVKAITHPPKGATGNAINSFTGSLAFVAAPRMAFIITNEEGSDRKLVLKVKNNIGLPARGIAYRILTKEISRGIVAAYIVWDDAPVDVTADEALYQQAQAAKGGGAGPVAVAVAFLETQLADGPKLGAEVEAAARKQGIAERTLRRARQELGVDATKDGYQGPWIWALSPKAAKGVQHE